MGEETEMVGPPFWDSKELEPVVVTQQREPLSFSSGFYSILPLRFSWESQGLCPNSVCASFRPVFSGGFNQVLVRFTLKNELLVTFS